MHRIVRLIAAAAGAAVIGVPATVASAQAPAITKVTPTALSSKSTFKKTARTTTVRTTGTLTLPAVPPVTQCPPGVTDPRYCTRVTPQACSGLVRVTVRRGSLVISKRRARVRSDCKYTGTVPFQRSQRRARGRLTITPSFLGNTYANRKTGPRRALNVGRS